MYPWNSGQRKGDSKSFTRNITKSLSCRIYIQSRLASHQQLPTVIVVLLVKAQLLQRKQVTIPKMVAQFHGKKIKSTLKQ